MDYLYGLLDSEEMYRIPADIKSRFAKLTLSKKRQLRKSLEENLGEQQRSPQSKELSRNILQELLTDDSSESEADEINRIFNSNTINESEKSGKCIPQQLVKLLDSTQEFDSEETHCSLIETQDNIKVSSSGNGISCVNITEDMERLQFSFGEKSTKDNISVDTLSQKVSCLGIRSPIKCDTALEKSPEKTQIISIESERKSSGKIMDSSSDFTNFKIESENLHRQKVLEGNEITKDFKLKMNKRSFNKTILTISSSSSAKSDEGSIDSERSEDDSEVEDVIVVSDSDSSSSELGQPPKQQSSSTANYSDKVSEFRLSGQTFLPNTLSNDKADHLEAFLRDLPAVGEAYNSYYDSDNINSSITTTKSTDESNKCHSVCEESIEIAETSTEHETNDKNSKESSNISIGKTKINSRENELSEGKPTLDDKFPIIEDNSSCLQSSNENKNPNSTSPTQNENSSSSSSGYEYEQISISAKFNIKIQINGQPNITINQDCSSLSKTSENSNSCDPLGSRQSEIFQENHKAIATAPVLETLLENSNENASVENIDEKTKQILTKLYGNQWQTPENIKKLDKTGTALRTDNKCTSSRYILSEKKGEERNSSEKQYAKVKHINNDNELENNERKIFKSPAKVIKKLQLYSGTQNMNHDESSIGDFSTFHRHIRSDLDSTRIPKLTNASSIFQFKANSSDRKPAKTKLILPNHVPQTEKPKEIEKTTRTGRKIKPVRWKQLYDTGNSSIEECSDDSEADATYQVPKSLHNSTKSSTSSAFSDGSYTTRSPSKTKREFKRKISITKTKSENNDEIVYLDLSNEIIKVQNEYSTPPASKDPRFNERLNSLLKTCTFQSRKPLGATPSSSGTKRRLFTPRYGSEEEILPPDSPLQKLDDIPDEVILSLPLSSIFGIPINKKLEAVKTGTPIFKIPTPTKDYESPRTKRQEKENDPKTAVNCETSKGCKTPKTPRTPRTQSKANLVEEPIPEYAPLNKYGFLKSLDVMVPKSCCHPDALIYRDNYKSNKEELAKRLYKLYNEKLFKNELDVQIKWNKKLINTAGRCSNKRKGNLRSSVIELSEKVLTSADRLRCTLIHELCHAATWIFNGEHGHGATWKNWAQKANFIFQELPKIGVCHSYDIEYKYTYKCMLCQAKSHAHSKSKKVQNIRCAYCHGAIEIFINKKDKEGNMIQTPVKQPTGFAKFVKENYRRFHKPDLKHGDIMKLLGNEFATLKVNDEK